MRTQTIDGMTLRYPDDIGMAFNPCLLTVEGEDTQEMYVTMTADGHKEITHFDTYNGRCYADVREYVQAFFDTMTFGDVDYNAPQKTAMGKEIAFEVQLVKQSNENDRPTFEFSVFYVWGAMKMGGGEQYNDLRKLTYFRGYPFTFGVYMPKAQALCITIDDKETKVININDKGVWNVPITQGMNAKKSILAYLNEGGNSVVVFDNTFDITFKYETSDNPSKVIVEVLDGCENGHYLRWIDRHGFYCYYLFHSGSEQNKTTADSLYMRNNLLAYDSTYGYRGNNGRLQQMNREDSVPVFAPLVDADTWDMLLDMVTSPSVDLFLGWKDGAPRWMSVAVAAGTYTRGRNPLQDFTCSIIMPETSIQKL